MSASTPLCAQWPSSTAEALHFVSAQRRLQTHVIKLNDLVRVLGAHAVGHGVKVLAVLAQRRFKESDFARAPLIPYARPANGQQKAGERGVSESRQQAVHVRRGSWPAAFRGGVVPLGHAIEIVLLVVAIKNRRRATRFALVYTHTHTHTSAARTAHQGRSQPSCLDVALRERFCGP